MSDERAVQALLEPLDRPRELRAAFARALRDELFGSTTDRAEVIDLEPTTIAEPTRDRPRRLGRSLLAAALIALLAIGTLVAVTQLGSDDGNVATRSGQQTAALVATACTRFNEKAFATVTRQEILGPERETLFHDRQEGDASRA